jgi:hypothetical protein
MQRTRLLLSFLGLGSFYGLIYGSLLGVVHYLVVFHLAISFYILYFFALGAFCGSLLGGFNGLILGIITILTQTKAHQGHVATSRYRAALLVASIIATLISSYIIFSAIFSAYSVVKENLNPAILLAMLMAIVASAYESQVLARWYKTL